MSKDTYSSIDYQRNKYFSCREFDSPDVHNSGLLMDREFMILLTEARVKAGIPFSIISGYRTVSHNRKVGGTLNSSHLIGKAADIRIISSRYMYIIVTSLLQVGFTRIGINNGSIHVDNDTSKMDKLIWTYY